MTQILLLDIAPDPVSTGVGVTGLVLIGVVLLMFAGAALTGFVFLFRRLTKRGGGMRVVVGDACLNFDALASRSKPAASRPISRSDRVSNSLRCSAMSSDFPLRLIKRAGANRRGSQRAQRSQSPRE